jgi:hypothetical protein
MTRSTSPRYPLVLAFGLLLSLTASVLAEGVDDGRPSRGGITVHGHWIIDVLNPDGSVASHADFENELLPNTPMLFFSGDRAMAAAVGGLIDDQSPTRPSWQVVLGLRGYGSFPGGPRLLAAPEGGPTCGAGVVLTTGGCYIVDGVDGAQLTVSAATEQRLSSQVPLGTIVLTARTKAVAGGTIGYVESRYLAVLKNTGLASFRFTGRTLSAPVPVADGQIIQLTVEFSFS